MRVPLLALLLSVGTIVLLSSKMQAQAGDTELPVSIDRIRAALNGPQPFQNTSLSGDIPTFRVEIQASAFAFRPTEEEAFDYTYGLPSLGQLVMMGIQNVWDAGIRYKRRYAERRARKEVDDALAAFCAVHDCASSRVDRAQAVSNTF